MTLRERFGANGGNDGYLNGHDIIGAKSSQASIRHLVETKF